MHDIGGGSRATQLALEFVGRGCHVTYVALYGTQESTDLGLRFIHPHLEQVRADAFDADDLLSRVAGPGLVVAEVPRPAIGHRSIPLRESGWTVVYDIIDDWSDPALGGDWYDVETEAWFMRSADQVIASAVDLANRSERMGATAAVVPNAVSMPSSSVIDRRGNPAGFPNRGRSGLRLRRVAVRRVVRLGCPRASRGLVPGGSDRHDRR